MKPAVGIVSGSPRSTWFGRLYWPAERYPIRVRLGCIVRNSALIGYCRRPIAANNHPGPCRRKLGKECVVSISKEVRAQRLSVSLDAPRHDLVFGHFLFSRIVPKYVWVPTMSDAHPPTPDSDILFVSLGLGWVGSTLDRVTHFLCWG